MPKFVNQEFLLSEQGTHPSPGAQGFFRADLNQYDVRSNLTDFIPWDDIFLFGSKQAYKAAWTRDDDGADTAGLFIKNQVTYLSKTPAVAPVDHIFFF